MTIQDDARTEAARRWPRTYRYDGDELPNPGAMEHADGFVLGAEWAESQRRNPVYLAADVWQALGIDVATFDAYYERNGWADTWATLLDGVRRASGSAPPCQQITDGEVCELIAGHLGPHMGASDVGSSEPLPHSTEPADGSTS